MASVAVFLALGGAAYALTLPKDSVGPKQIKSNGVKGKDALESSFDQVPSAADADTAQNAINAANADKLDNLDSSDIGLGFFTGRVNGIGPAGTKGSPPSGLSTANLDPDLADEDLTLSPSRDIVMRGLSVTLTQPVGCSGICGAPEFVTVRIEGFTGASATGSISCNIFFAGSTCTAAGPSTVVAPSSGLRLDVSITGDVQIPAGTDALFSWRATAP